MLSDNNFLIGIIAYKKLKVYEKLLNYCTKGRLFLIMALVMPGVQILLCYTAMQAVHSEQISKFVAFLFVQTYLTILTFSIFLFSATAQINNVSTKWILECKTLGRTRLEMRMQKSLTSLRLEFGNNFVEALTPLVVQDFCVRQTVSGLFLTG